MLYIVATPIGNLNDITLRALKVLKSVDFILAEDTRTTRKLLLKYSIRSKLFSYNDYNKQMKTKLAIRLLNQGKKIALVSESGTPCISDPGYYLVRACIKNNIDISCIPGVSAVITALVVSGMPTDSFLFLGFLPKSKEKRKRLLLGLKNEERTVVCFESPHRLISTLEIIESVLKEWHIAVCRELTKKFENVVRFEACQLKEHLSEIKCRGEITLVMSRKGIS